MVDVHPSPPEKSPPSLSLPSLRISAMKGGLTSLLVPHICANTNLIEKFLIGWYLYLYSDSACTVVLRSRQYSMDINDPGCRVLLHNCILLDCGERREGKRIPDCGKHGVEGVFFAFRLVIGWWDGVVKGLWGPIGGM